MYTKRGGVAAYHIVWIGLCLRSVPGVRVLASASDDGRRPKHVGFFLDVFNKFLTSESVHVLVLTIEWSYYVHGTNAIITRCVLIFCTTCV